MNHVIGKDRSDERVSRFEGFLFPGKSGASRYIYLEVELLTYYYLAGM